MPNIKRLFWDIETSPNRGLFFRAGYDQNINPECIEEERKIICIGYKWAGDASPVVLRWDSRRDDAAMLRAFGKVANEADELVAHYGDRFDLPWFRGRCLLNDILIPEYKTIDTKAWASKYFSFNSNKLDYLAGVMGFGHKLKTDFQLWKDIMGGDAKKYRTALDYMCKYCGVDVIRLEQVYNKLAAYVKPKTHVGVLQGRDKWTCPKCGSDHVIVNLTRVTAAGTVSKQMRCRKCGAHYSINAKVHAEYQEAKKK